MTAQNIEASLKNLKVNSLGRIIGKSKAINDIQSMHLSDLESKLTDIRIFVAKQVNSESFDAKAIDEFIYKIQIQ